jgi:hypothetical protein
VVLAAVAVGVATVITGSVVAVFGWAKDKVLPPEAVTVAVQRDRSSCTSYVIPKNIGEIGPPPVGGADTAWSDWALARGGAEMDWTKVLITVRGVSGRPVTVTGLTFSIKESRPALTGSLVSHPVATRLKPGTRKSISTGTRPASSPPPQSPGPGVTRSGAPLL